MKKPAGYWDYEHCYEEAKKCKTRSELRKRNKSAYVSALKNCWIDDYVWLVNGITKLFTDKIDCVYYYYFEQSHSIYIGRTIDKKRRDREHIFKENDIVHIYARKCEVEVPPMEIIEDKLTIEEGLIREDYWKNYYKDKGYNVLNINKTGLYSGSLGTITCGKWTKEKVFEEAKKYKTKKEFEKGNASAYQKALKRGWLQEMDWFVSGHINTKSISKTITQYTLDGVFIKEYPSMGEAERQTGINRYGISLNCQGKNKSAGGYIWKYAV